MPNERWRLSRQENLPSVGQQLTLALTIGRCHARIGALCSAQHRAGDGARRLVLGAELGDAGWVLAFRSS